MKKFKTKAELKSLGQDYLPATHADSALKCDICERTFSTESELTAHEIQHMKLTCGICHQNFKTRAAFEQHELNHPKSAENTGAGPDKMLGKAAAAVGHVCLVCKKKFKTAGQLNYHSIHHSDVDIKAAQSEGEVKKETKSPAQSNKPPASLASKKPAMEKFIVKESPTVTSRPSAANSRSPAVDRPAAQKATASKRHLAADSSDSSDQDEDEKKASPFRSPPVKKSPTKPVAKPTTSGTPAPAAKAGNIKAPPERDAPTPKTSPAGRKMKFSCEKCRKKFNEATALEYHSITFHVTASPVAPRSSKKNTSDSGGRRGTGPKSKEYVEDSDTDSEPEPSPVTRRPAPAPPKRKTETNARSPIKKAKPGAVASSSEESDEDDDEDEEDDHKAHKNKALLKVTPKPAAIAQQKQGVKVVATPGSAVVNKVAQKSKAAATVQANKRRLSAAKKKPDTKISSDEDEDEDEDEEEEEVLSGGKRGGAYRTSNLSSTAISRLVSSKKNDRKKPAATATAATGGAPRNGPATSSAKATAAPTPSASNVLLAEVELRRNFVASKSDKVPCDLCGRSMANESVLAYHKIRCTGDAKKNAVKQSRESEKTTRRYSSDTTTDGHSSDVRLSVEDVDKKSAKPVPAKSAAAAGGPRQEKKQTVVPPSATVVPTFVPTSDSEDEPVTSHQLDRRRRLSGTEAQKKSSLSTDKKNVPPPLAGANSSKYSTLSSSSSSSDEDLPLASPLAAAQNGGAVAASPPPAAALPLPSPSTPENNTIFGAKFSRASFQEILQADLLREKQTSSKSEKVKCEFCHKPFKNETVLQHHNIFCTTPKEEKVKAVPSMGSAVKVNDLVEMSIIKQRASQSPVDMILKKLSASAQSEDTASHNSESDSASNLSGRLSNNATPRHPPVSEVKCSKISEVLQRPVEKPKSETPKSSSDDRSPERSPPKGILKSPIAASPAQKDKQQTCKLCGISLEHKNVLLKHIRECHDVQISVKKVPKDKAAAALLRPDNKKSVQIAASSSSSRPVRQDIRTLQQQKRVSIYTSSEDEEEEEEDAKKTSRSSNVLSSSAASPGLHPNAKHGVEILEEEMNRRRKERKARKERRKEKKVKKAKKKKNNSSSENEEKAKEEKKRKKKKKRSRFAIEQSSEDEEESFSASAKGKKNPLYCFCDKMETMDMIGCDYCDMWYHPECLGVDETTVKKLTESNSWMCPECVDNKDPQQEERRSRESSGSRSDSDE